MIQSKKILCGWILIQLEERKFDTYIKIKEPQIISGQVVTHQLRSIDYTARNIIKIEQWAILTWFDVLEVLDMFV